MNNLHDWLHHVTSHRITSLKPGSGTCCYSLRGVGCDLWFANPNEEVPYQVFRDVPSTWHLWLKQGSKEEMLLRNCDKFVSWADIASQKNSKFATARCLIMTPAGWQPASNILCGADHLTASQVGQFATESQHATILGSSQPGTMQLELCELGTKWPACGTGCGSARGEEGVRGEGEIRVGR